LADEITPSPPTFWNCLSKPKHHSQSISPQRIRESSPLSQGRVLE
jgi:hypothetical protein